MIVADCDVVVALVLPRSESLLSERLQRSHPSWVAPPLILSELRSVMGALVRSRQRSPSQAAALFLLATEGLEAVTFEPDSARVLALVAESGCSTYDCEYVAVAEELGCRLATFDRAVLGAFPAIAAHPEELAGG